VSFENTSSGSPAVGARVYIAFDTRSGKNVSCVLAPRAAATR
jgi:hypothetical protein